MKPQQTPAIDATTKRLIHEFAELQFAMGEWDKNENDEPFDDLFARANKAELKLLKRVERLTAGLRDIRRLTYVGSTDISFDVFDKVQKANQIARATLRTYPKKGKP